MLPENQEKSCPRSPLPERNLLIMPVLGVAASATESPLVVLNNEDSPAERTERSDAAANRRRILVAAEKLFAEHGAHAVNMADIAKAAKVGQGTLYRRFSNKGELCLALLDSQMADFQNSVLLHLGEMTQARSPFLAQLDWFLDAMVYFHERHLPLLCVAASDLPILQIGRPSAWVWEQLTVRGLLQSALRKDEIRREGALQLDVPVYADLLLAPLQPGAFELARHIDQYSLERISAGVRMLVALLK